MLLRLFFSFLWLCCVGWFICCNGCWLRLVFIVWIRWRIWKLCVLYVCSLRMKVCCCRFLCCMRNSCVNIFWMWWVWCLMCICGFLIFIVVFMIRLRSSCVWWLRWLRSCRKVSWLIILIMGCLWMWLMNSGFFCWWVCWCWMILMSCWWRCGRSWYFFLCICLWLLCLVVNVCGVVCCCWWLVCLVCSFLCGVVFCWFCWIRCWLWMVRLRFCCCVLVISVRVLLVCISWVLWVSRGWVCWCVLWGLIIRWLCCIWFCCIVCLWFICWMCWLFLMMLKLLSFMIILIFIVNFGLVGGDVYVLLYVLLLVGLFDLVMFVWFVFEFFVMLFG